MLGTIQQYIWRLEMGDNTQGVKRIIWLDGLKGIGIVFVFVGHIYKNETILGWLHAFVIPLFFFCSGYVHKKRPFKESVARRFASIMIPYFFLGLAVFIYWALVERKFRGTDLTVLQAFFGFISGENHYLDFSVHLWFLPCLFVTVILYNELLNLLGKKGAWVVVVLITLVVIFEPVFDYRIPYLPWGIDRMCKYLIFYAGGSLVSQLGYAEKMDSEKTLIMIIAGIVMMAINFFIAYKWGRAGIIGMLNGFLGVFGMTQLMCGQSKIEKLRFVSDELAKLGQISLVALCIHGPIYRVLIKLATIALHTKTEAVRENILCAAVIIVGTLLICRLMYMILDRFVPWGIGKLKFK